MMLVKASILVKRVHSLKGVLVMVKTIITVHHRRTMVLMSVKVVVVKVRLMLSFRSKELMEVVVAVVKEVIVSIVIPVW